MRTFYGARPFIIAIAIIFAISLPLISGCKKEKETGGRPKGPVPVLAAEAVTMDVPDELREIGSVEAFSTVEVTARISGQLMKVGFAEGSDIKTGDLLFQIDPRPYEASLAQAQANLERDKAALAKAQADLARYETLVKKDYITKQEYDLASATAAGALATVKADSALIRSAGLNLEYCTIRSPLNARAGNILVKPGNIITANTAAPLVILNQITPVYVSFAVPEQYLSEIQHHNKAGTLSVKAFIPTDSTTVFDGKLTFIDNQVNSATGTILLKGTFPNQNRALWPSQYVRVRLILGVNANATVVPSDAIQTSQDGKYVYVIAPGDTVQMRPVVVGDFYEGKFVIEKGLAPKEKVVTDGHLLLTPGAKVKIKDSLMPGKPGGVKSK